MKSWSSRWLGDLPRSQSRNYQSHGIRSHFWLQCFCCVLLRHVNWNCWSQTSPSTLGSDGLSSVFSCLPVVNRPSAPLFQRDSSWLLRKMPGIPGGQGQLGKWKGAAGEKELSLYPLLKVFGARELSRQKTDEQEKRQVFIYIDMGVHKEMWLKEAVRIGAYMPSY